VSTILKNILQFTGLVVGVPVSLPHGLNINDVDVKPHIGGANATGFTFTADATNVTATRTADATSGAVDVYVEHWHSIEAALPLPGQLAGLFPFFFSAGGGGGGGATADGAATLIYKPGSGETGPVVFDTWAGLYAQLTALRALANSNGIYTIQFDNSGGGAFANPIPAGAYDMANCHWVGTNKGQSPDTAYIAEGATFTGGPFYFCDIAVFSFATATPPWTVNNGGFEDRIVCEGSTFTANDPGAALWSLVASSVNWKLNRSAINAGANPTIVADVDSGGNISVGDGSSILDNALNDGGFGNFSWSYDGASAYVTENQPSALASTPPVDSDINATTLRSFTLPVISADQDIGAMQYLNPIDGSGAAGLTMTMLQQALKSYRYQWSLLKEQTGLPPSTDLAEYISLYPFGAETIEGGPGMYLLPGQQVALVADGVSNWAIAYKTAGVPEKVFASLVMQSNSIQAYFNAAGVRDVVGQWTMTIGAGNSALGPIPAGWYPVVSISGSNSGAPVVFDYTYTAPGTLVVRAYNLAGAPIDPQYVSISVSLAREILD
jgi:hypothetical protein